MIDPSPLAGHTGGPCGPDAAHGSPVGPLSSIQKTWTSYTVQTFIIITVCITQSFLQCKFKFSHCIISYSTHGKDHGMGSTLPAHTLAASRAVCFHSADILWTSGNCCRPSLTSRSPTHGQTTWPPTVGNSVELLIHLQRSPSSQSRTLSSSSGSSALLKVLLSQRIIILKAWTN